MLSFSFQAFIIISIICYFISHIQYTSITSPCIHQQSHGLFSIFLLPPLKIHLEPSKFYETLQFINIVMPPLNIFFCRFHQSGQPYITKVHPFLGDVKWKTDSSFLKKSLLYRLRNCEIRLQGCNNQSKICTYGTWLDLGMFGNWAFSEPQTGLQQELTLGAVSVLFFKINPTSNTIYHKNKTNKQTKLLWQKMFGGIKCFSLSPSLIKKKKKEKEKQLYDLQANAMKAPFPISFQAISGTFRRCCRGPQSAGGHEMTAAAPFSTSKHIRRWRKSILKDMGKRRDLRRGDRCNI